MSFAWGWPFRQVSSKSHPSYSSWGRVWKQILTWETSFGNFFDCHDHGVTLRLAQHRRSGRRTATSLPFCISGIKTSSLFLLQLMPPSPFHIRISLSHASWVNIKISACLKLAVWGAHLLEHFSCQPWQLLDYFFLLSLQIRVSHSHFHDEQLPCSVNLYEVQ